MHGKPLTLPEPDQALPGRDQPMPIDPAHYVNGHSMVPPYPDTYELAMFGLVASGAPSASSGRLKGSMSPLSVMPPD